MIVKVQLSLATTKGKRQVLVYNKKRTIEYEDDASPELINLLGDQPKAFFHAYVDEDNVIRIQKPAEWQDW